MSYEQETEERLSLIPVMVVDNELYVPLTMVEMISVAFEKMADSSSSTEAKDAWAEASSAVTTTVEYLTMMYGEHLVPDSLPEDFDKI